MAFELKITGDMLKRAGLALLSAVVIAGIAFGAIFLLRSPDPITDFVDESRYQAVFLTDGRVFFGHVRPHGDEYYEVRDAFYIQQIPAEKDKQPTQEVRPRTAEIHGPQDRMLIPRDVVSIIENLRPDSELVKTFEARPKE